MVNEAQGHRKHLKLGGHDTSRALFSLSERGNFLKMKTALLCILQNLGGHVPPLPPVPMSLNIFKTMEDNNDFEQGRRKHLKLGGHDTSRAHFSLRRRGHVLNMKRALLCLLKNLGGHVPPVPPVPTSLNVIK